MELYATDAELVGWLIILAALIIGIFICWLRYGRNDRRASDHWLDRHIDDRGKYRP